MNNNNIIIKLNEIDYNIKKIIEYDISGLYYVNNIKELNLSHIIKKLDEQKWLLAIII